MAGADSTSKKWNFFLCPCLESLTHYVCMLIFNKKSHKARVEECFKAIIITIKVKLKEGGFFSPLLLSLSFNRAVLTRR